MKLSSYAARAVITAIGFSAASQAAIFFDSGQTALTATDPIQLGRLSRARPPSDWSRRTPFPGIVNPATAYHYTTYTIAPLPFYYLQISFDDMSGDANTFVSAYLNSYDPTNKALNYLGDEGASGNYFGVIPTVFQVRVPFEGGVVIVVNDASATGAGVGQPYDLLVEGFSDTSFNENTPEPSQWLMNSVGLGAAVVLTLKRRRRKI